jgi:hypothetical protein
VRRAVLDVAEDVERHYLALGPQLSSSMCTITSLVADWSCSSLAIRIVLGRLLEYFRQDETDGREPLNWPDVERVGQCVRRDLYNGDSQ